MKMKVMQLSKMQKGWFIGDFEPSILRTQAVEVAVKTYKAGDQESSHCHKIATEVTLIISGEVEMRGGIYKSGDMIMIEPGEASAFKALSDTISVVVKTPSVVNDKYPEY